MDPIKQIIHATSEEIKMLEEQIKDRRKFLEYLQSHNGTQAKPPHKKRAKKGVVKTIVRDDLKGPQSRKFRRAIIIKASLKGPVEAKEGDVESIDTALSRAWADGVAKRTEDAQGYVCYKGVF